MSVGIRDKLVLMYFVIVISNLKIFEIPMTIPS